MLIKNEFYVIYLKFFYILKNIHDFRYFFFLYEYYKFIYKYIKYIPLKYKKLFLITSTSLKYNLTTKSQLIIYKKFLNTSDISVLTGNVFVGLSKIKLTYYNQSFKWFYSLNVGALKHFTVVLNIEKLFKVFLLFKQLVYGLGFYSFYIFAFGTAEFEAEVNSINKIYRFSSLNKYYFNYFSKNKINFFTSKIPYNLEVENVMTNIAAESNKRDFYIVVQEKALASFFVQKVNSCAVGFFTYTPQKHSYNFLVPIFIENFFIKAAMYSYVFCYWKGGKKLYLLHFYYFILNFKMYKFLFKY